MFDSFSYFCCVSGKFLVGFIYNTLTYAGISFLAVSGNYRQEKGKQQKIWNLHRTQLGSAVKATFGKIKNQKKLLQHPRFASLMEKMVPLCKSMNLCFRLYALTCSNRCSKPKIWTLAKTIYCNQQRESYVGNWKTQTQLSNFHRDKRVHSQCVWKCQCLFGTSFVDFVFYFLHFPLFFFFRLLLSHSNSTETTSE